MSPKKKKPAIAVTLPMVGGWLASLSLVLTAVLPVLPASTPTLVRELLAVAAVAIAATLQSWRQPPSGDAP
jgi:hypothetical protein